MGGQRALVVQLLLRRRTPFGLRIQVLLLSLFLLDDIRASGQLCLFKRSSDEIAGTCNHLLAVCTRFNGDSAGLKR